MPPTEPQETPLYFNTATGQKLAIYPNWIIYFSNLMSDWLRLMHQGFELEIKTQPRAQLTPSGSSITDPAADIEQHCQRVESTLANLIPHIIQAGHVDKAALDDPETREAVLTQLLLPEPQTRAGGHSPSPQDQLSYSIQQAVDLVRAACASASPLATDIDTDDLEDGAALPALSPSLAERLDALALTTFQRVMGAENIVGSEDEALNAEANEALRTAFNMLQDHITPPSENDTTPSPLPPLERQLLNLYEGATLQTVLHMQGMMLPEEGGETYQTAGYVLANFGMLQTSWEDTNRLALSSNPRMALAQELYVITNTLGRTIQSDGQIKEAVCASFQIAADKPAATPLTEAENKALLVARGLMTTRLTMAEKAIHRFISTAPAPRSSSKTTDTLPATYN